MNHETTAIRVAILTVSDSCARGEATDTAGPALCEIARERLKAEIIASDIVPDEPDIIGHTIEDWADDLNADLILTAGGTGLGPRDVTPEATRKVIERRHAGLIQLMLMRCYEKTPLAFLSRGIAGTINSTLVINLPGSRKGSTECMEALLDVLPHAIQTLRGDVKEHGRAVR